MRPCSRCCGVGKGEAAAVWGETAVDTEFDEADVGVDGERSGFADEGVASRAIEEGVCDEVVGSVVVNAGAITRVGGDGSGDEEEEGIVPRAGDDSGFRGGVLVFFLKSWVANKNH